MLVVVKLILVLNMRVLVLVLLLMLALVFILVSWMVMTMINVQLLAGADGTASRVAPSASPIAAAATGNAVSGRRQQRRAVPVSSNFKSGESSGTVIVFVGISFSAFEEVLFQRYTSPLCSLLFAHGNFGHLCASST